MKLTAKLLKEIIKKEIEEAKYGGNSKYRRDKEGMRDMNRGVGWGHSPKKINSFKERVVPTLNWVKSMDNWLTSVASNPQMTELGYQYEAVSDEVTSAMNSATEANSLSQDEFDLILSALEYINEKIEEVTRHPVGGAKQQEKILNYRMPSSLFTSGKNDFIRGEE